MKRRRYESYTDTRDHLRDVFDSADAGAVTTVKRGDIDYLVVQTEQQRRALVSLVPATARVVAEGGGWAVLFPGLPIHGDGATFEDAVTDAIEALRDYAADWNERLKAAPNHVANRSLVELIELSDDGQLRAWVLSDRHELTPA